MGAVDAPASSRHLTPATPAAAAPAPPQTVQQSLEVAQEACNDLDLRATQVGAVWDAAAAGS